jgi:hypothetical protein
MIYEGTNEIQAIDLLVRKVLPDGGVSLEALLDGLLHHLPHAAGARIERLRTLTQSVLKAAAQDATLPYRVADDYLRALGLVLLDWAWWRIRRALHNPSPEQAQRWLAPAQALDQWVLPEFEMRCAIITQQCALPASVSV